MQKLSRFLVATALIFTNIIFFIPENVHAGANDFYFKKFDVNYHLTKKDDNTSKMSVEETLVAEFPNYNQNHGIERKIPFLNQADTNLTMDDISKLNITVTRNGQSEPYTVKAYDDNYFLVRIGNPDEYVHGENTYVLKYEFVRVITKFDSSDYFAAPYQELYWNANGNYWAQRFDEVNVNLTMDDAIYQSIMRGRETSESANYKNKNLIHKNNETKEKLAAWCYVGRYKSNEQNRCKISDIKNGINFNAKNLAASEGLTFVTNFNKDTFVVPKNDYINKEKYKNVKVDYYFEKDENGQAQVKVVENFDGLYPTADKVSTIGRTVSILNSSKNRYIGTTTKDERSNLLNAELKIDSKRAYADQKLNLEKGYIFISGSAQKPGKDKYLHGEHNVVLSYRLHDVVDNFANDQKFIFEPLYGFAPEIEKMTVTIHLTDELKSQLEDQEYNSTSKYTVKNDGNNIIFTFAPTNKVVALSKLNISFKKGTFNVPEPNKNYVAYHAFIATIILAGLILFIFYLKTIKALKNKTNYLKGRPVAPEYQPPKGLSVGQAAKIYMKPTKNPRVATLLELIVNKKLQLICDKKHKFGKSEWSCVILDLDGLTKEQEDLLKILNRGKAVTLNEKIELKRHAYSKALNEAFLDYNKHINADLESNKYLEPKKPVSPRKSLRSILFSILAVIFTPFIIVRIVKIYTFITKYTPYSVNEGVYLWPFTILIWIATLTLIPIVSSIAAKYQTRTEKALDIVRYLEGLKLYIKMAEKDRIAFLQSVKNVKINEEGIVKLNEKLLPYAAIFGLEKSWLKELSKYYELHDDARPDWYDYNILQSYSNLHFIISAATSQPIDTSSSSGSYGSSFGSSSSSGGGGGGFSGGGGGGGGGGGW